MEEGTALLNAARNQAVVNLIDNDEFSLRICIRALDPDLVMKMWIPGISSDDRQVKMGCLEALKQISGQKDGFGFDPAAEPMAQRMSIARWNQWYDGFMDERRRPASPLTSSSPPGPPPVPAPLVPGAPVAPSAVVPASTPAETPAPAAPETPKTP